MSVRECGGVESVWWICVGCVLESENDDTRNEVWVRGYGKVLVLGGNMAAQLCVENKVR